MTAAELCWQLGRHGSGESQILVDVSALSDLAGIGPDTVAIVRLNFNDDGTVFVVADADQVP